MRLPKIITTLKTYSIDLLFADLVAGITTPIAGIAHAVVIFLVLTFFAHWAGYLAMPALAALLILTAWNMAEPHKWRGYASSRRADLFLLLMTLALTVLADLTVAIGVGVARLHHVAEHQGVGAAAACGIGRLDLPA